MTDSTPTPTQPTPPTSPTPQQQQQPHARYRVCLVGCGRMGQYRAALIAAHPALEPAATVDPDAGAAPVLPGRAARAAPRERARGARARRRRVRLRVVAAPTRHHADVVLAAAQSAWPPRVVFCEKLIAGAVPSVAHCYHVCRRARRRAALRLDAPARRGLRAARARGRRAPRRRRRARARSSSPPTGRPSRAASSASLGSIFEDLMCHDFNAAEYLMHDALPRRLAAEAHSSGGDDLPDTATCTVYFGGDNSDGEGDGRNSEGSSKGAGAARGTTFHITATRTSAAGTYENSAVLEWSGQHARGVRARPAHALVLRAPRPFVPRRGRPRRRRARRHAHARRQPGHARQLPSLTAALAPSSPRESARRGGQRLYLNRPFPPSPSAPSPPSTPSPSRPSSDSRTTTPHDTPPPHRARGHNESNNNCCRCWC